MALIVIHRTLGKDLHEVFRETIELLSKSCGDVMKINHSGLLHIDIPGIKIRFVCGDDMSKLSWVLPDYWDSDGWIASKFLEQRACCVGGKALRGIYDLPNAILDIYSRKGDLIK